LNKEKKEKAKNDKRCIINANRHSRTIIENNEKAILDNLLANYTEQNN